MYSCDYMDLEGHPPKWYTDVLLQVRKCRKRLGMTELKSGFIAKFLYVESCGMPTLTRELHPAWYVTPTPDHRGSLGLVRGLELKFRCCPTVLVGRRGSRSSLLEGTA